MLSVTFAAMSTESLPLLLQLRVRAGGVGPCTSRPARRVAAGCERSTEATVAAPERPRELLPRPEPSTSGRFCEVHPRHAAPAEWRHWAVLAEDASHGGGGGVDFQRVLQLLRAMPNLYPPRHLNARILGALLALLRATMSDAQRIVALSALGEARRSNAGFSMWLARTEAARARAAIHSLADAAARHDATYVDSERFVALARAQQALGLDLPVFWKRSRQADSAWASDAAAVAAVLPVAAKIATEQTSWLKAETVAALANHAARAQAALPASQRAQMLLAVARLLRMHRGVLEDHVAALEQRLNAAAFGEGLPLHRADATAILAACSLVRYRPSDAVLASVFHAFVSDSSATQPPHSELREMVTAMARLDVPMPKDVTAAVAARVEAAHAEMHSDELDLLMGSLVRLRVFLAPKAAEALFVRAGRAVPEDAPPSQLMRIVYTGSILCGGAPATTHVPAALQRRIAEAAPALEVLEVRRLVAPIARLPFHFNPPAQAAILQALARVAPTLDAESLVACLQALRRFKLAKADEAVVTRLQNATTAKVDAMAFSDVVSVVWLFKSVKVRSMIHKISTRTACVRRAVQPADVVCSCVALAPIGSE